MKHPKPPANSQQSSLPSQFRIIGGTWRSRKFRFPPTPGLRPTPDRVRETLFNWLNDHLHDATCLDLFCGSGALGLEALSRGARHCTFVDASPQATTAIRQHLQTLQCPDGLTLAASLPDGLARLSQTYDLVFLDPPYALPCITACLEQMVNKRLLNDGAMVYVECSSQQPLPEVPAAFLIHRHKTAGQVQYALLHFRADTSLSPEVPL